MEDANDKKISAETTSKIKSTIDTFLKNVDQAASSSRYGIPTLDQIESAWGALENDTRKAYREMVSDVISEYDEKKIIKSKKPNTEKGA